MAFLAGILPPLIWAFAAVNAAGGGYGFETLWHQVVDRLFPATASHQHAWWYYLMYLPALAFPWIFWPGAWSASRWCEVKGEWQVRFLLVVAMTALLILTASSGKRFLYLLPIYPALALLVARLLAAGEPSARLRTFAWFPLLIAALGACAMAIGYGQESVPELFREGMAPWFGPVLLLFAVCYLLTARIGIRYYAQALALLTVTLMLAGEVAAWRILQLYDPSRLLSAIPDVASVPLAMHPRHRGQFGYAGRRIRPIDPVPSEHEIRDWAEKNPDGYLIAPMKAVRKMSKTAPLQIIPYGFQSYGIWKAGRF
jgi:4-amino-4-deoxy-L-arabinose transferase-like glycosyltransferase